MRQSPDGMTCDKHENMCLYRVYGVLHQHQHQPFVTSQYLCVGLGLAADSAMWLDAVQYEYAADRQILVVYTLGWFGVTGERAVDLSCLSVLEDSFHMWMSHGCKTLQGAKHLLENRVAAGRAVGYEYRVRPALAASSNFIAP